MKERLIKAKEAIKRNAPVIIITSAVTALGCAAVYYKLSDNGWHNYVLSPETLKEMAGNVDATVVFKDQKVLITGRPWDPSLDTH